MLKTLTLSLLMAATGALAQPFASFDLASDPILNDPHDLALGPDGHIYVADKFAHSVAVLDAETLELVEVLGAGRFPGIHDIAFGPDGRVALAVTGVGVVAVFADRDALEGEPDLILPAPRTEGAMIHSNGRVYAMASGTGAVLAYEGDRLVSAVDGHFGAHDIEEAPDGTIWVADNFGRRLAQYSPDLVLLRMIEDPLYRFVGPRYLDIDEFGRLLVADQDGHRVLLIDPAGGETGALIGVLGTGEPGLGPGLFDDPEGALVVGTRYYVSDSDNNRVVRYSVVIN